jgi:hypothetical protein
MGSLGMGGLTHGFSWHGWVGPWVLLARVFITQPMGDPTRGWVGFSGGFGAVYIFPKLKPWQTLQPILVYQSICSDNALHSLMKCIKQMKDIWMPHLLVYLIFSGNILSKTPSKPPKSCLITLRRGTRANQYRPTAANALNTMYTHINPKFRHLWS